MEVGHNNQELDLSRRLKRLFLASTYLGNQVIQTYRDDDILRALKVADQILEYEEKTYKETEENSGGAIPGGVE